MKRILTAVVSSALPDRVNSHFFFMVVVCVARGGGDGAWACGSFTCLPNDCNSNPILRRVTLPAQHWSRSHLQNDPAINVLLVQFVIIALTVGTLIAATLRGAPFDKMIASTGATILGVLYVALLGSHLVSIRIGFDPTLSAHLLSFFFLVLMGADTGAYYIGRAFGKHKLAPTISPGKTWEGAIGGVVAALAMAALAHFWFFRELPLKCILPLAAVMTVLGIFGDLTESALKRGAGAKDAANILPGHGGILDRLDSLLFNAPLIYYFARFYFQADR